MGQTLTHGVYLPDEGERNCYNGLAANWQLLDGAVGTIAEHTSALAGKAPLVHTHTKSDVTDLLNSNFIPSANNSYDLGSSSYQWNNLYAKNYYYNGVAWGLDKANKWSATQWFLGSNIVCKNNLKEIGSANSGGHFTINFYDKNDNLMGWVQHLTEHVRIGCKNKFTNGVPDPNGTEIQNYLSVYVKSNGTKNVGFISDAIPEINNSYNLGTSTNKWKSLNGINPGALSFPDYTLAKMDLIDFSQWSVSGQRNEYTPASDGWLFVNIKDTASNSVFIYAHSLYNADPTKATDYSASCFGNGSQGVTGRIAVMIPVRAGIVYGIIIKAASVSEIYSAKFYPALGNV